MKDDDTQNSCGTLITENNEKMSLLLLQVDKLNNCISDPKSLNLNRNRATTCSGELTSNESGLFSTDSSGNRIINPCKTLNKNPIMSTKIRALNTKAIAFNRLIFSSINKFWSELDSNSFVNESGLLDDNFGRHYNAETGRWDRTCSR